MLSNNYKNDPKRAWELTIDGYRPAKSGLKTAAIAHSPTQTTDHWQKTIAALTETG